MILRLLLLFLGACYLPLGLWAQAPAAEDSIRQLQERIDKSFTYQTGQVTLGKDLAILNVPTGYRFLNAKQSQYVLTQLWGNPPDSSTLGMLFPNNHGPFDAESYAVGISYSEEGYIKDDDAKELDYADLLKEMQQDTRDANPARVQEGYPAVELVGWASSPFYDSETHKLHWAKELKFEEAETNTLNYNIRILGRKGYLMLNVIGDVAILPQVKKDIPQVLAAVDFAEGNRYRDFNPEIDEVAAYGIGGLIAGKVLAKVGFFALILKFWKIILGAAISAFYYSRKRFMNKNDSGEKELVAETVPESFPPV